LLYLLIVPQKMYTLGAKQKDSASGTPFKTYLNLQISVGTMI